MDEKVIEEIQKWLERWGISKEFSAVLAIIVAALFLWLVVSGVKALIERRKNLRAENNLKPHFYFDAIEKATAIYIPTKSQMVSPAREDEPGFTHKRNIDRRRLIPYFLKTAFNEKRESERFYLILADSGMGKTTFMINLYLRYHSFFNFRKRQKMKLFRFSHPDIMEDIKAIKKEEATSTILLLDALDEDPNIVSKAPDITDAQAFQHRVNEVIEATRNFSEVVITCRTQYFPGQEDDPFDLKVKRSDEKGFYTLNKLYISPFNDDEVKRYLNKKYGYWPFWNRQKKKRAARVVNQSRHLVMRPMMLSYIDYLVEDNRSYNSDYDIYETLIEKWLVREAEKRKIGENNQQTFINNLREVSEQTAIAIWKTWQEQQRMYLTKGEAVNIAEQNQIDLKPEEVTGQSLLTCDGVGNWKFAHKSIWEFFLAKKALEDFNFLDAVDSAGMDMTKRFFEEKIKIPENFVLVRGGIFTMGSKDEGTPHEVSLRSFLICKYQVTQAEYEKITGKPNPSYFKGSGKNPVEQVSWLDAIEFCNLLNKKSGLPASYDDKGNLLDSTGKITTDITKVRGFRLPTEAEWEYAARGGNQSKGYEYTGSNYINEVAWFEGNSGKKTHPVGGLRPNELGLYDMNGNVWEWCHDWYDEKYYDECKAKGTIQNPVGPEQGSSRVLRGGSWLDANPQYCRVAYRNYVNPGYRDIYRGFRLAASPSSQ